MALYAAGLTPKVLLVERDIVTAELCFLLTIFFVSLCVQLEKKEEEEVLSLMCVCVCVLWSCDGVLCLCACA